MTTAADMLDPTALRIWWAVEEGQPGTTVDTKDQELPTTGYYVGGESWTLVRAWARITRQDVIDFVAAHPASRYIGMWMNGGRVYLDAVTHTDDQRTARNLGRDRRELSVYNITAARSEAL